jgi:carbon storage regulator
MLVLTRRIGESIRIGDGVRLTILSKLRAHLTVALAVPTNVAITDDTDMPVSPVRRRHRRGKRYLIAVMVGDSLRIGDEVVVSFGDGPFVGYLGLARGRQVRIGVDAPREVPVHREEVYQRIQRGESDPRRERH